MSREEKDCSNASYDESKAYDENEMLMYTYEDEPNVLLAGSEIALSTRDSSAASGPWAAAWADIERDVNNEILIAGVARNVHNEILIVLIQNLIADGKWNTLADGILEGHSFVFAIPTHESTAEATIDELIKRFTQELHVALPKTDSTLIGIIMEYWQGPARKVAEKENALKDYDENHMLTLSL